MASVDLMDPSSADMAQSSPAFAPPSDILEAFAADVSWQPMPSEEVVTEYQTLKRIVGNEVAVLAKLTRKSLSYHSTKWGIGDVVGYTNLAPGEAIAQLNLSDDTKQHSFHSSHTGSTVRSSEDERQGSNRRVRAASSAASSTRAMSAGVGLSGLAESIGLPVTFDLGFGRTRSSGSAVGAESLAAGQSRRSTAQGDSNARSLTEGRRTVGQDRLRSLSSTRNPSRTSTLNLLEYSVRGHSKVGEQVTDVDHVLFVEPHHGERPFEAGDMRDLSGSLIREAIAGLGLRPEVLRRTTVELSVQKIRTLTAIVKVYPIPGERIEATVEFDGEVLTSSEYLGGDLEGETYELAFKIPRDSDLTLRELASIRFEIGRRAEDATTSHRQLTGRLVEIRATVGDENRQISGVPRHGGAIAGSGSSVSVFDYETDDSDEDHRIREVANEHLRTVRGAVELLGPGPNLDRIRQLEGLLRGTEFALHESHEIIGERDGRVGYKLVGPPVDLPPPQLYVRDALWDTGTTVLIPVVVPGRFDTTKGLFAEGDIGLDLAVLNEAVGTSGQSGSGAPPLQPAGAPTATGSGSGAPDVVDASIMASVVGLAKALIENPAVAASIGSAAGGAEQETEQETE